MNTLKLFLSSLFALVKAAWAVTAEAIRTAVAFERIYAAFAKARKADQ